MKENKFRGWNGEVFYYGGFAIHATAGNVVDEFPGVKILAVSQYSGIKDKNGSDIYEDDILRFSDKWEWYRGQYAIKMLCAEGEKLAELKAQYEAEPYEERLIKLPEDYEWLLSSEIQSYWEIVGNKYKTPELLAHLNNG